MSDTTTIPFFDEIQPDSTNVPEERKSQRIRKVSERSERDKQDSQSTITVNRIKSFEFRFFSRLFFQLYQGKAQVQYAPMTEVSMHHQSETASIRSKSKLTKKRDDSNSYQH